jgi:hypothetical protein
MRKLDITSRAMLAQFTVSQWEARKTDKRATLQTIEQNNAKRDSGTFHKSLIAKDALADIKAVVGKARQDHADMSLPWLQDGTRILPVDAFDRYTNAMQAHRQAFERAVSDFCVNYPDFIEQARDSLGDLFNPDDYPPVAYINRRFSWHIAILPMPAASDFRVDMDSATVALIQSEMNETIDAAIGGAMRDVSNRLYSVVKAMADKLSGYDPTLGKQGGVFRDSLVENIRELLAVLPALNLTGDKAFADLIEQTRDKLATHDAATLRDDSTLRNETAKAAADIADALAGFM